MAVCDECGNETFSQIAGNVMICDVCGAESLAFTQDVIDTEEGFFATQPSQKGLFSPLPFFFSFLFLTICLESQKNQKEESRLKFTPIITRNIC